VKKKLERKYVDIVKNFSRSNILVIGDLILDRYLLGVVERISPEAPVPILRVTGERSYLGGAANVALNLRALGVNAEIAGVVGNDLFGKQVIKELEACRIAQNGVFFDPDRTTTVKIRPMAGAQQLLRIDFETDENIASEMEEKILASVRNRIQDMNAVIFADYRKGLLTESLVSEVIGMAKEYSVKVFVDPNIVSFEKFRGAYLIKPNKKEAEQIAKEKILPDYSNLADIGKKLRAIFDSTLLAITLGADGMALIHENEILERVETSVKEVYDVSGAGDTVISVLASALAFSDKVSFYQAAYLASLAAGIVVNKRGVATASSEEIISALQATR
jgi:D-beta-D-heptose 7-phosphate kinase/D-beta-D-heptose 1-phosphate adenosyltransferase